MNNIDNTTKRKDRSFDQENTNNKNGNGKGKGKEEKKEQKEEEEEENDFINFNNLSTIELTPKPNQRRCCQYLSNFFCARERRDMIKPICCIFLSLVLFFGVLTLIITMADGNPSVFLLVDISNIDVSYTVPIGSIDQSIKQGSMFYFSGLIMRSEEKDVKRMFEESYCLENIIEVDRNLKKINLNTTLEISKLKNLGVVGEFTTKLEVINSDNHKMTLKWLQLLFSSCNTTLKDELFSNGTLTPLNQPVGIFTTYALFYGPNFREDATTLVLGPTFYKITETYINGGYFYCPYYIQNDKGSVTQGVSQISFVGHSIANDGNNNNNNNNNNKTSNGEYSIGSIHVLSLKNLIPALYAPSLEKKTYE